MGRTVKDLPIDEQRARQLQLALRERLHVIRRELERAGREDDLRDYWLEQLSISDQLLRDLVAEWQEFF
jgi:hypothetical protein